MWMTNSVGDRTVEKRVQIGSILGIVRGAGDRVLGEAVRES